MLNIVIKNKYLGKQKIMNKKKWMKLKILSRK